MAFSKHIKQLGPLDLGDYELVASEVGFSDDVYLVTGNAGSSPMYYQVYSNVTYANNGISESIELNAHWMGSFDSINGWQGQLHQELKMMSPGGQQYSIDPLNYMDFYIDSFGDLTVVQDMSLLIAVDHMNQPVLDWNCGYYSGAGMNAGLVEPIAHLDPFDKMHLFSMDEIGQLFFGVSNSSYSSLSGDARCIDMEPFDSPDEFGFTSGQDLQDYRLGGGEVTRRGQSQNGSRFQWIYPCCVYQLFL